MKIAQLSFALTWALAASFATSMIGMTLGPWFVQRYFDPSIGKLICEQIYDWPLANIVLVILPSTIYTHYYTSVYEIYFGRDGWDRMIRDLMTESLYARPIICAGFLAGLVMPTVYALLRYFIFHG